MTKQCKKDSPSEIYMVALEEHLQADAPVETRASLIVELRAQLADASAMLRNGVEPEDYDQVVAWKSAVEAAISVVEQVRTAPIPLNETQATTD